jgi:hypothetical protein
MAGFFELPTLGGRKFDLVGSLCDVVPVSLTPAEVSLAKTMSRAAELGGQSSVRSSGARNRHLAIDQYVGVGLGELAGNKYFFDVALYRKSREIRNAKPRQGDGGSDSPGWKIDYRTSIAKKQSLLSYNLVVRPQERHKGFVYVLLLVRDSHLRSYWPTVHLIGWASDDMLDGTERDYGVFDGAYVLPATSLKKIADLRVGFQSLVEKT